MTKDLTERLKGLRVRLGGTISYNDSTLLTEAASLIQRLEGERDAARLEADHQRRCAVEWFERARSALQTGGKEHG